jgi:hypothetical protein
MKILIAILIILPIFTQRSFKPNDKLNLRPVIGIFANPSLSQEQYPS